MRILFCLVLLVAIVHHNMQSQTESDQKLKFGFNIGMNYSMIKMYTGDPRPSFEIVPFNGIGFRMGILADYRLTKFASFVPKAEISFSEGGLRYIELTGEKNNRTLNPVTIDLSPHFQFYLSEKSARPYILLGGSAQIPLPDPKKPNDIYGNNFTIDIGLGLEKTLKFFNLSPEFRYSYGFSDLSDSIFLRDLRRHNVTLVLNFKG
jgi:hypothetical protein